LSLVVQNEHVQAQAEDDVVVEDSILLEEQGVNTTSNQPSIHLEEEEVQLATPLEEHSMGDEKTTSTQPSIHMENEEVHSFGGEWRDSWRLEKSGNGSHAKEKKEAKRRRNRTNRKLGGIRLKEVEPKTVN
jgi:hypothetical protein